MEVNESLHKVASWPEKIRKLSSTGKSEFWVEPGKVGEFWLKSGNLNAVPFIAQFLMRKREEGSVLSPAPKWLFSQILHKTKLPFCFLIWKHLIEIWSWATFDAKIVKWSLFENFALESGGKWSGKA